MKEISLLLVLLMSLLHGETFKLVDQGKLSEHALLVGKSWQEKGVAVIGKGTGEFLRFAHQVKAGDFEVTATIKLDKIQHTAAGLSFGQEFFGFDSSQGIFLEGGDFDKQFIKNTYIEAGKDFAFKATASKGKISFFIDGKKVVTKNFRAKKIRSLALRPHRNVMTIRDFAVTGGFIPQEKLNFIFKSGQDDYHTFRIPALITSKKGTLLAFAEGRVNSNVDHGDMDIVLKRSFDNGKTWQDLQVVTDDGKLQCGNPAPLVDYKNDRIFLVSCGSDSSESAVMNGKAVRKVYIQHSKDDGKSWSKRREITSMVKRESWRWYATGPCSGIQIRTGQYKGRLVVPANHSVFENNRHIYRAHSLYSDDFGKTWKIGAISSDGGNESQIAEAGKDLLYHTIRMQSHRQGMRGSRYSTDGAVEWTETKHDNALHGSRCQASVVRDYSKKSRLIFANPAKHKKREGMTIRVSENAGKTWPYRKLVFENSSAYSDLAICKNGDVAILFEGDRSAYWKVGFFLRLIR